MRKDEIADIVGGLMIFGLLWLMWLAIGSVR